MNLIVTIATGDITFGQLALNLILSIKATSRNQKVLLIYEAQAIKGIEELIEQFADYRYEVYNEFSTAHELAFYTKTCLYDIIQQEVPEAKNVIFLDADTIMIPGRDVDEWFSKHDDKIFTAYCNDIYDIATNTRKRKDYQFWMDVENVAALLEFREGKIPQINTSFLYFKMCEEMSVFFSYAKDYWHDNTIPYVPYRNVKPDEFCFNMASLETEILPHQNPYRPIFFQFSSEQQNLGYVHHHFKCFGFAGEIKHADYLINYYNELSSYYREKVFGILLKYRFKDDRGAKDTNTIKLKPLVRRTILRAGEVENSEGGIFNPSGIIHDGQLLTVMRKELNLDVYKGKYSGTTSIPFVSIGGDNYELNRTGFDTNLRLEDFRIFKHNGYLLCNHTIVFKDSPEQRHIACGLSFIDNLKTLRFWHIPNIERGKVEKNWVFFSENNRIYLLYSLSPYKLYYTDSVEGLPDWKEFDVPQTEIRWFHYGAYICNSTNPILVDDYYLIFYHTKEKMKYFHGAALINKDTKKIEHYTRNSFDLKSSGYGIHKDIFYISGAVLMGDKVRVFAGECDTDSTYIEWDKDELINAIKRNKA